jgi:hypothetical protein
LQLKELLVKLEELGLEMFLFQQLGWKLALLLLPLRTPQL